MPKFKVWTTKIGYYEVSAKDKDEAHDRAHNGAPEPEFHVTDETTDRIEISRKA
jgi:hypothetical protein